MIGILSFGGAAIASGVDIANNLLGFGGDSEAGTNFYIVEASIHRPFVDPIGPDDLAWLTGPNLALCGIEAEPTTDTQIRASDVGYRCLSTDSVGVLDYPATLADGITFDVLSNLDPTQPGVAAAWGTLTFENVDGRYDTTVATTLSDGQPIRILRGVKPYEQFPGYRTFRATPGTGVDSNSLLSAYVALDVRYNQSSGTPVALNEAAATNYVQLSAQAPSATNVTVTVSTDVTTLLTGQPVYKHLRTLTGGDTNTGAVTTPAPGIPGASWLPGQPIAPSDTVLDTDLLYSLYGSLADLITREDPANGYAFTPALGLADTDLHFTRASTATYFGSTGSLTTAAINAARFDYNPVTLAANGMLIEPARTNSFRNSMYTGAVVGSPGTLPTNTTSNNNNSIVPKVAALSTENGLSYIDLRFNGTTSVGTQTNVFMESATGISASSGQDWTGTFYVTLAAGSLSNINTIAVSMDGVNSGGTIQESQSANITPTVTSLPLGRLTRTRTLTGGSTTAVRFRITVTCAVAPVAIDFTLRIAGIQIERGLTPSSFIPTTSAAVSRSADVCTMPATALIPLDRSNICLQSADLSASPWVTASSGGPAAPTVTANSVAAPDATITAALINFPACSAGMTEVRQPITVVAGGTYTFSVWLRGALGGEITYLIATVGTTAWSSTRCILTTTWTQYSVTRTMGAAETAERFCIGTDLGDSAEVATAFASVYAWGAQVERAATVGTYLPTTVAANTVSARMTGCTLIAECYVPVAPSVAVELIGLHNSAGTKTSINITSGNNLAMYDSGGLNTSLGAVPAASIFKVGYTFVGGTQRGCVNGGSVVTGSLATLAAGVVDLAVGCDTSALQPVCYIRHIRVIPRLLSSAELQVQTATVALRVSAYVWIPTAMTISTMTIGLETNVTGAVTGSANTALRDQWQRVTGTANLTMGTTTTSGLVRYTSATNGAIFYTTAWQIEIDGGAVTSFIPPTYQTETYTGGSLTIEFPTTRDADNLYVARNIWLDPSYDDLVQVFKGVMGPWFVTPTTVQVTLRDASYYLERTIPRDLFTEPTNLVGVVKPKAIGGGAFYDIQERVNNVTPVLIDAANLIYQVNDGPIQAPNATVSQPVSVADGGAYVTFDVDVSDLTSGIATPGTYRTCCALGQFQLGSAPTYTVTADFYCLGLDASIGFPDLIGSQLACVQAMKILTLLSVPVDLIAGIQAEAGRELLDGNDVGVEGVGCDTTKTADALHVDVGLYLTSDDTPTGVELMARLLSSTGASLVPGKDGRLRLFVPAVVPAATAADILLDDSNIISIERLQLPTTLDPPPWRFRVAYDRNYTVQAATALAGAADRPDWRALPFRVDSTAFAVPSSQRLIARPSDPPILAQLCSVANQGTGTSPSTIAQNLIDLWGVPRRLYGISVPQSIADQADWGTLIQVTSDFDELDAGVIGQCCGWRYSSLEGTATLRVLL